MSRITNIIMRFLLGAVGAFATAGTPAASLAATVEIVGLDFESGKEAVLAVGEVRGEPKILLADPIRGSLDAMVDECGSVYVLREDKRTVEFRHPEAVLQGLRFLVNESGKDRTAFFSNDQAYEQRSIAHSGFDKDSWDRKKDAFVPEYNAFGTPIQGWPTDKKIVAAGRLPGRSRSRLFVVDDKGTLFGVHSDASGLQLKKIGEEGAHSGTVSLAVGKQKIFTLRENGRIFVTDLGQSGWGIVGGSPLRLGTEKFSGATVLRARNAVELVAIAHQERSLSDGKFFVVDARDGSLMSHHSVGNMASAGAADLIESKDRFDHRIQYDVAFARVSNGAEFGTCVDKEQLLADFAKQEKNTASRVEEAKAAFAALRQSLEVHESALNELDNHHVTLDEAEHIINKSTLGDRISDIAGQIEDLGAVFDEFEASHVTPMLEEKRAFLEKFGTVDGSLASEIAESGCCRRGTLAEIDALAATFEGKRAERARGAIARLRSVFSGSRNDPMRAYYRPALSKKEMKSFEKDAERRRALYERAREVVEEIGEEIVADTKAEVSFMKESEAWFSHLDEALETSRQKGAAQNASAVWPSRLTPFQGPGDADELERVALEFVQAETGDPYFEAHVCKGWQPFHRDSLGRAKDYAIGMCMVRADNDDPDFARTVWVVLYTVGPEMAPPFSHVAITEKSRIAMDRREGGRPDLSDVPGFAPSGGGGSGGGGGWPGSFLRILTGFALFGTGMILAGPTLAQRVPALQPIVETLGMHAQALGRFAFGVGAVGLVAAVLTLSPVANTIPIAACLATGLLIWRPSMETPQVEALPEQIRDGVARILGTMPVLAVRGESLGRVALALAPIHLLLGGFPFV